MVQKCCVPLCSSKAGDVDIYGTKVRFHRMPQSPERSLRWCIQITDNRKYRPVLTNSSRVCSRHFRKEDYLLKKPFGPNPLKYGAEPCIFTWNSACFENNAVVGVDSGQEEEERVEDGMAFVYDLGLRIHREIQCCLLDKQNVDEEVGRKNSVIEQLLGKIGVLEEEQRGIEARLEELRAANLYYEKQLRNLQVENTALEQRLTRKSKKDKQDSSVERNVYGDEEEPKHKKSCTSVQNIYNN